MDPCVTDVGPIRLDISNLVVLIGHELAANAVAHAQTDFVVRVAVTAVCVEVAVSDPSPEVPHLRDGGQSSIGQGLKFVAA
jgi:hypothetical protein